MHFWLQKAAILCNFLQIWRVGMADAFKYNVLMKRNFI
jgi:hypothetical protein